MSENLNKKPPKGILKQSSSFDKAGSSHQGSAGSGSGNHFSSSDSMNTSLHRKSTKFDEMNIIETLHPPDKDYGHMKIEEPKTPFNYYEDGEDPEIAEQGIDPALLKTKLESQNKSEDPLKSALKEESSSEEEEGEDDPEVVAKRQIFESKRKAHYNEYYAVKLARKLLEQEQDEEDNNQEEDSNSSTHQGFIPNEELDGN
jgi:protein phosphatase inhibitor 2